MSKKESNAAPDIARPVPPPAPPARALSCVTHHHACDCREAEWAQKMATQQAEIEALREDIRCLTKADIVRVPTKDAQQAEIEALKFELYAHDEYSICDCCQNLTLEPIDAGGHIQCIPCTKLANQQARIEELEHYNVGLATESVAQQSRIAELEQQLAELREVTRELANDVEAYADVDRHGRFAYPHIMAKWESDMEPVNRARALLQERSDE